MKLGCHIYSSLLVLFISLFAHNLLHARGQTEVTTNFDGTSDSFGSSSAAINRTPLPLHVTFRNDYDTTIYLFWRREGGAPPGLMGPIDAGSDSSINTVQGHVFFACFDLNGTNRSLPYEVGTLQCTVIHNIILYLSSYIYHLISPFHHSLVQDH